MFLFIYLFIYLIILLKGEICIAKFTDGYEIAKNKTQSGDFSTPSSSSACEYNRPSSLLARGSSAKVSGSHRGVPVWVESAE